jgi:hypothetical protein
MSGRRMSAVLAVMLTGSFLTGCERYVVVDPAMVPSLNARDWTIRSQPGVSTGPSPPPPVAAPAAAPAVSAQPVQL